MENVRRLHSGDKYKSDTENRSHIAETKIGDLCSMVNVTTTFKLQHRAQSSDRRGGEERRELEIIDVSSSNDSVASQSSVKL